MFRWIRCALAVVLCVAMTIRAFAQTSPTWLARVNFYRATARLAPVTEDVSLSRAIQQHARYMVEHGVVEHVERAHDRWTTVDGAAAAAVSNLAGSTSASEPDDWAVDVWMQAPFHAVGILDPSLARVGFGIDHRHKGAVQTAAGLDVIRGRTSAPVERVYPIVWPADGATIPIAAHIDEYPSPLTSCPGYTAPAGLPILVQFGADAVMPPLVASRIFDRSGPLEHCVFDGASYRNSDPIQERLGRTILASRHALVLIPRKPLSNGAYRVVVEAVGLEIGWKFSILQDKMTLY